MAASSLRGHRATSFEKSPRQQGIRITWFQAPLFATGRSGKLPYRDEKAKSMQKSNVAPLPTLSVRIDLDTEGRIGPGKIQLLEKIQEFGSISAAGRAMNMSYKRAWDLVDEINRLCRQACGEPADWRQEWRRGDADAFRALVGRALPEDRARRRQRCPQGTCRRCAPTSIDRRRRQTVEKESGGQKAAAVACIDRNVRPS